MENKFTLNSYALMALLAIRTLGQILSLRSFISIIGLIFTLLYLGALVGVFLKKRWGTIITIIIAVIDILGSLTFYSGAYALGSATVDVLLMFLGYREYKTRAIP